MIKLGDRYDGRLLRSLDPFYKIIPFIMKSRVDALVYFDDQIDINTTEAYIWYYAKSNKPCKPISYQRFYNRCRITGNIAGIPSYLQFWYYISIHFFW